MTPQELRSTRERLGFTQAQLAAELDVQPNTVARWERGELPISRVTEFAVRYLKDRPKRPTRRQSETHAGATL